MTIEEADPLADTLQGGGEAGAEGGRGVRKLTPWPMLCRGRNQEGRG